jgi:hypothetical protein
MKITSKQQMKRMLAAGEFGNAIRSWATYEEMVAAGYKGKVYVRSDLWSATNARMNEVPLEEVMPTLQRLGISPATCRYFENPPNDQRLIQGEICYNPDIALTYSFVQKPLSDALLQESHHVHGAAARAILQAYLRPESLEWLEHLLEVYDGAAVEFTEFRTPQGMLNQHLAIWEVRHF